MGQSNIFPSKLYLYFLTIYSTHPLSTGNIFQDPQWMPESVDSNEWKGELLYYSKNIQYLHSLIFKNVAFLSPSRLSIPSGKSPIYLIVFSFRSLRDCSCCDS